MKLKKCLAVLLSAAVLCTTAVSMQPKTKALAEEQEQEYADLELQKSLGGNPIIIGKGSEGASFPATALLSSYEKKMSYMYMDSSKDIIKSLSVDSQGNLTPTKQNTGAAEVTISVMYNYQKVYTFAQTIMVEKSGENYTMKNEAGEEVTKVVAPTARFELTIEDPSIATINVEEGIITVLKGGETNLVLSGYLGDELFGRGTCRIVAEGMDTPSSETPAPSESASAKPPVPSEPASSQSPEPSQRLKGDADGNNKVELKDAQLILKAALDLISIEDEETIKACDMNGTGKLELTDAQIILKMALDLI